MPTEEEMYSSKGREDQAAQLARSRSRKDGPTDSLACLSSSSALCMSASGSMLIDGVTEIFRVPGSFSLAFSSP